jgi:hypothetical protein
MLTFPQTFDENNERVRSEAPVVEITLKMDGNNALSCDIYFIFLSDCLGTSIATPKKIEK